MDMAENDVGLVGLVGALTKVEVINDAGGVNGRLIEAVVLRPDNSPSAVQECIRELVETHGVGSILVLTSILFADEVKNALDDLDPEKRPLCVFPLSIDMGIERLSPYFIRILQDSGYQAEILAEYMSALNHKTLAIIYDNRFSILRTMGQSLAVHFRARGGDIVSSQPYSFGVFSGDEDFTAILDEVKSRSPDIIAVLGYPEEVAQIIYQSGTIGLATRLCGGTSWNSEVVFTGSGQNLDGCFFLGSFLPEDLTPRIEEFVSEVQKTGIDYPGNEIAASYDAVGLLAFLAGKTEDDSGSALLAEFHRSASEYEMVTGYMTLQPNTTRFIKDINIYEIEMIELIPSRKLRQSINARKWLDAKKRQGTNYLEE
jgi:branched-chain amino acid transport system substrate-binding protein